MKIFLYVLILILLAGCATPVPVTRNFPNSVPELMKKCQELKIIEGDKIPMTDFLAIVVENYTLYYECANKVNGWQQWYIEQKKLFESEK